MNETRLTALGQDPSIGWPRRIRNLAFVFLCFCIIGWIYEEVDFLIEDHVLQNRGALFGPWLPVYGFGGLLIIVLFYRLKNKPVMAGRVNLRPFLFFIYVSIFAVAVELIATYIIDATGGDFHTLWTYEGRFMNFDGRVALIPGLKFGVIGLLVIYGVQPLFNRYMEKSDKRANITVAIMYALFLADCISRLFLGQNFHG